MEDRKELVQTAIREICEKYGQGMKLEIEISFSYSSSVTFSRYD